MRVFQERRGLCLEGGTGLLLCGRCLLGIKV